MPDNVHEQSMRLSFFFAETDSAYHEAALKMGLTDSAMNVLYTLCQFDGVCPLGKIMSLSGTPKQTVNSALRWLEKKGALCLESVDGRKKRALLTEKGMELCAGTVLRLMAMEDEIYESWLPEERAQYLTLTRRYLESLREKIREL